MATPIRAWKAFDGTIFTDKKACETHNVTSQRMANALTLVNKLNVQGEIYVDGVISGHSLESWLVENADAVIEALTVKVENRGRKPQGEVAA